MTACFTINTSKNLSYRQFLLPVGKLSEFASHAARHTLNTVLTDTGDWCLIAEINDVNVFWMLLHVIVILLMYSISRAV